MAAVAALVVGLVVGLVVAPVVAGPVASAVVPPSSVPADAQSTATISGPIVTPSRSDATPGERVTLSIDGFDSLWVTVSVCGNEARRGSSDCNLSGSVTNEFNDADMAMALSYVINAPPTPCPCVLRVVGRDTSEVALAPFDVTGHTYGPVQDPPMVDGLFDVVVRAQTRATGAIDAIRAELGGPSTYEVTVRVTNTSTMPLRQLRVAGSVGPNSQESLSTLNLDDPGLLGVGQTWEQTVTVVVPAPSFGSFVWRVSVSGAGPTVVTTAETTHRPWLLIAFVMLIAVNICVVLLRMTVRRRSRAAAAAEDRPEVTVVMPGEMPIFDNLDGAQQAVANRASDLSENGSRG